MAGNLNEDLVTTRFHKMNPGQSLFIRSPVRFGKVQSRSVCLFLPISKMPGASKGSRDSTYRTSRPRKRKAPVVTKATMEDSTRYASASSRKLAANTEFNVAPNPLTSYCIISFLAVFPRLSEILECKKCKGAVTFNKETEIGLGFHLHVSCACSNVQIPSSPREHYVYEINRKFVFVMRMLSIGHHGIQLFCSLMDLSASFGNTSYYGAVRSIAIATAAVFDAVTRKVVSEEKNLNAKNGDPENELSVSGDGSWSKRGFSSLIGVVTIIGKFSGKVIDVITKSSVCKGCERNRKVMDKVEFEIWYQPEHVDECLRNHEGSAGKMEVDGVIEMFRRSVQLYNVKYTNYIGDGDAKTFSNLLEANVYGDATQINKRECVLHVGKRMFRRLSDAKKNITQEEKLMKENEKKSLKIDVHRVLSTKLQPKRKSTTIKKKNVQAPKVKEAKLTGKIIREMSTYYGLAIQRNPNSIDDMEREIWSGYFHKISTDANPQHQMCKLSWCKYLQAQENGTIYHHKPALEEIVQKYVKKIYEDLTDKQLLKRCLGKNTQNSNESFNATIWQFVPKHIFHGKEIVEFSARLAACIFNEGFMTVLQIMTGLGIDVGQKAVDFAARRDADRKSTADQRATAEAKRRRLTKKAEKTVHERSYEVVEGLLYGPGID